MYVKYRHATGRTHVREVKNISIRPQECQEDDGSITAGAELYDACCEADAEMMDRFAEYVASLIVERPQQLESRMCNTHHPIPSTWDTFGHDYTEGSILRWFNSWEAAERVLADLCGALRAGIQFFDMTVYGEDGEVLYGKE